MFLQATLLSKKFEDHIVFKNLSFTLEGGKVYQVSGQNGSGKSTLLKILAGLLQPTSGRVEKKPGLKTGYSSLELNLYPDLTVSQTLTWCSEIKQMAVPFCSLPADQMVGTLSSGQTSYLKLLIATLNQPDLLILDEINATFDPINKQGFLTLLQKQQKTSAIVFTSHDQILDLDIHHQIILS